MPLRTEPYRSQVARWPQGGRHILAQYDATTVVVYQAYAPAIGRFAAEHGWFGGPFSYERMSWIKPNFLWMMYRSGWARSRAKRSRWRCTSAERRSAYVPEVCESEAAWKARVRARRSGSSGTPTTALVVGRRARRARPRMPAQPVGSSTDGRPCTMRDRSLSRRGTPNARAPASVAGEGVRPLGIA